MKAMQYDSDQICQKLKKVQAKLVQMPLPFIRGSNKSTTNVKLAVAALQSR